MTEISQFFFDGFIGGDSTPHFLAQQIAISRTEPGHVAPQSRNGATDAAGQFFICARSIRFYAEMGAKFAKKFLLPGQLPFLFETLHDLLQQGGRPLAVEHNIRVGRRRRQSSLRVVQGSSIQRQERHPTSALLSSFMCARVRHEMLKHTEEKRTETPLLAVGVRVGARLDDVGKEPLREILCVFETETLTAQENKNRPPIDAAKLGQRA